MCISRIGRLVAGVLQCPESGQFFRLAYGCTTLGGLIRRWRWTTAPRFHGETGNFQLLIDYLGHKPPRICGCIGHQRHVMLDVEGGSLRDARRRSHSPTGHADDRGRGGVGFAA